MNTRTSICISLIGMLLGAIAYWFQAYNQMTVLGIHIWLIISIGSFIGSLLLTLFIQKKPTIIALFFSLGVLIAVLARIIYDVTFWDSTSHNLAPFEIIFCIVLSLPAALVGAFMALLISRMRNR